MYRQSPTSRNHRSKEIKLKHILKFCLLLAVCFWLIYQVKHSYDKKKEFDENDTKTALQGQIRNDFVTIGRRGLNPRLEETKTNNEKHDEGPEDEDPTLEVEENKNEDDGPEDEKISENEDGDDEIVEHIQDKTDSEIDGEEDFVDNENETEEKDLDDAIGGTEMGNSSEQKNEDGDRETREENYKADDASSAVTHNIQMGTTEKENEGGEIAKDKSWSNVTTKESTLDKSLNGSSSLNDKDTKGSDEVATGNHDLSLQNLIDIENNTFVTNSTGHAETRDAESNSTSSNGTESSLLKKFREEASFEEGNHTESSAKENGGIHIERLGVTDDQDEVLASEMMENPEEDIQHDSIDSSDSLEEKDVRMDLGTLPEIRTEGTNSEDAVAE